jgi:hypothetical protein
MEKQQKPDWITDEQWEANPNVYHWEQSRKAMQFLKQSQKVPITHEEVVQQMRNRRISLGLDPKDYDDLLNEQK